MVRTPIMLAAGYVDWVYPWRIVEGIQYLMFGDHFGGEYCPIEFIEVSNDPL